MYRITLHVPEHFNDGSSIPEEILSGYHRAMGEIAYKAMLDTGQGSPGYQVAHEEGGWLLDGGDWTEEPMRLIKIIVAVLDEPLENVRKLAALVRSRLGQAAVYVTHEPDIGADLVTEYVSA